MWRRGPFEAASVDVPNAAALSRRFSRFCIPPYLSLRDGPLAPHARDGRRGMRDRGLILQIPGLTPLPRSGVWSLRVFPRHAPYLRRADSWGFQVFRESKSCFLACQEKSGTFTGYGGGALDGEGEQSCSDKMIHFWPCAALIYFLSAAFLLLHWSGCKLFSLSFFSFMIMVMVHQHFAVWFSEKVLGLLVKFIQKCSRRAGPSSLSDSLGLFTKTDQPFRVKSKQLTEPWKWFGDDDWPWRSASRQRLRSVRGGSALSAKSTFSFPPAPSVLEMDESFVKSCSPTAKHYHLLAEVTWPAACTYGHNVMQHSGEPPPPPSFSTSAHRRIFASDVQGVLLCVKSHVNLLTSDTWLCPGHGVEKQIIHNFFFFFCLSQSNKAQICIDQQKTAYLALCLQPPVKTLGFRFLLELVLCSRLKKGSLRGCKKHLTGGVVANLGETSLCSWSPLWHHKVCFSAM